MYWLKWDSHLTSGTAKSRAPLWYNQNSLWSSLSSASLCVAWFSGTVLLCYRKRVTHWLQPKSLCSMSGKLWLAARVSCPLGGGGGARLAFGWQPIWIPKCWEKENFSKRKIKKCGAGKKDIYDCAAGIPSPEDGRGRLPQGAEALGKSHGMTWIKISTNLTIFIC